MSSRTRNQTRLLSTGEAGGDRAGEAGLQCQRRLGNLPGLRGPPAGHPGGPAAPAQSERRRQVPPARAAGAVQHREGAARLRHSCGCQCQGCHQAAAPGQCTPASCPTTMHVLFLQAHLVYTCVQLAVWTWAHVISTLHLFLDSPACALGCTLAFGTVVSQCVWYSASSLAAAVLGLK